MLIFTQIEKRRYKMNFKEFTKITEMTLNANKKSVEDIKKMTIVLNDDLSGKTDNVFNALINILEEKMEEKEYIDFLETL